MPLIPSLPAGGPTAPASTGQRGVARAGDQDTAQPGSFGEALARLRTSSFETAAEPADRTAPAKLVRRGLEADDMTAQAGLSPDSVLLMPPQVKLAAVASTSNQAGNSFAVGLTEAPEMQVISGTGGLAGQLTAAPAVSDSLVAVACSMADTQAAVASAPGLVATTPKGFDLTPPNSRETPAGDGMLLAADPQAVSAMKDAADQEGFSGPSDPSAPLDPPFGPAGEGTDRSAKAPDMRVEQALIADPVPVAVTGTLALPVAASMQHPSSVFTPGAPASTASMRLLPEVGSSEWGKALGQQVIDLSTDKLQMAELQLNPPGLGPLKVTLSVSDQQMQASFISAHSSVRVAVETALPQLRALLAESGISLGQTSVGAESQPQTTFASSQGSYSRQPPRQGYGGTDAGMAAPLSDQPTAVKRRPGQGLRIDTYA